MLCLREIHIVFYRLIENSFIYLFQRYVGNKISLQIGLQEKFFIGILRI